MASDVSAVVEHSTQHPKVEGLNPGTADAKRERKRLANRLFIRYEQSDESGTIFTALHFLHTVRICPISYNVT